MMGALIGLTEVVPIKLGLFPAPVAQMMGRMRAGLSPNSLRHASALERKYGLRGVLGTGLMEATQEASANWLQALSARGLYDPNAMEDVARSMAEDFKVGGVVGGIAKLVQHQILRSKFRGYDLNATSLEENLRRAVSRQDQTIKDISDNITGISKELSPIFQELGVEKGLAQDITNMFGGKWAAMPFGIEHMLKSGQVSRSEIEQLVKEFEARNTGAKIQLDKLIEFHFNAGNNAQVEKYTKAKDAIDKMSTARLDALRKSLVGLGGGLGDMGGLSGNAQYQGARQAAMEADGDAGLRDVYEARRLQKEYGKKPSYLTVIRSLMGGSYRVGGLFKMAELLGVHRGPGSEKINLGVAEDLTLPDLELASSDRANFSIAELGSVLFASRGRHGGASTAQQYVDKSDVMSGLRFVDSVRQTLGSTQRTEVRKTLFQLNERLKNLERDNDNLYKDRVFTRELSEIQRKKKYANNAEWIQDRDRIQSAVSMQSQSNNANISRITREKSIIYLRLLNERLQFVRTHLAGNLNDKQKAAERVFGEPDTERFDAWLDKTIDTVIQSEYNGNKMKQRAEEERLRFDRDMAQVDAPDADKKAMEASFLSENSRRFIELPRDISAPQFIKIANLFIDDPADPKNALQDALELRAYGDISQWQVEDALWEVTPSGIPDINPTKVVVKKLENKLGKLFRVTTDESGNPSARDGRPEDISVDDITELLRSKNIYLRDGERIGNKLAGRTGAGVESRPFKKLLLDMTGAVSWGEATFAQRLLMYSRLLQLPAHRQSRGSPEDQHYLRGTAEADYRPLFLPDFYYNPSIDSHINFMTDRVIEATEEGGREFPSLSISGLKRQTQKALGNKFNGRAFDEALARLIETGAFIPTAELAPAEAVSRERPAAAHSEVRVTFNVNYDPEALAKPSVGELGTEEIGDTKEQDEARWFNETRPELTRRLLSDPRWANQIDDMLAYYNERNPDKQLKKKDYIKQYTALITSTVPLQELSDLGILDTVQGAVTIPGKLAPTESVLNLGTPGGRNLVRSLMKSGALPSSMQDNVQALRRRFIDQMTTRFEVLDRNVEELVKKLRLPDNIQRQYVDDVNGMFQFLGDVAIRGEEMNEGLAALYDRPGNRIIINLAAIDPNNMVDAQEVVKDAAFHEGLHALIIRDHLTDEELNVLYNFVRNEANIVPEKIDKEAHDAGLTWFERSVVASTDKDTGIRGVELAEADIEKEAVISLLENLMRHPDVYVEGKKTRNISKGIRGFLEGFVDAAKDSDIVDVMRILGRIERGEVGERGAGFLGDTEYTADSMIRSNDLLRYANPEDIKQLRAAIVLRDAAPSGQMRESEQAKVDVIADKIVANRGIIQESAPPIPSSVDAIEDQRKLIQHMRDTHAGQVPLLGLDQKKKNSEAYKLALNTFMEMRGKDPRYAYKMPAPYQAFFNERSMASSDVQDLVDEAYANKTIAPTAKDAARKSLEEGGALSGDPDRKDPTTGERLKAAGEKLGNTVSETRDNLTKQASQLRYNYLDRRQWVVEQTDRLIAAQNRAQLDAETSALVMWRNSDNALNWLPSLMLRGPLSYLGTTVGSGRFENAPVYDDELQEKHGGDGRVWGLNNIFALIPDSKDSDAALIYGIAKRVLWTKDRRDTLVSSTRGLYEENISPEVRRELERAEQAYKDIKEGIQFTTTQLNEIVRKIETNESNKFIVEFWDRYNAYNNHMIKMSYNTGMITREQRDEWLSMPYTPFYSETLEEEGFPVGSQEEIRKRGINKVEKALKGSMRPITRDLANSVITNTQALVRDAMMNVAASRTARDAMALGEARIIDISGLAATVNNRVIRVMEDGVPVFYELSDPQLAMSVMMLGFNPKKELQKLFGEHKIGKQMQKALTGASWLLRESVTRTPPFAMKNVFRDSWTAMSLTGGGPKLVFEAFRNALDLDSLRRADELGISIGIDFVAEPGEYGSKMKSELAKSKLNWKNPFSALSVLWNFSGRIAKQSEVATRLAVYDRILAMTGNKATALHYAIEIMNYGRRGASPVLSTYMATIPFMNGRIQGADVTYRGLRSKKGSSDIPGIYGYGLTADEYSDLPSWQKNRAQIMGRGLALTFATWALYMLMRDDDEWQDLRDEVKADNWVLPLSDHAWLKIPIPFEVGVLFKVIPEKMFEAITEKDVGAVDVADEVKRQISTTLSFGGWPQLFAPIVGAMRNYDAFRKDAIVDHWMEETVSPNEQRNMYTSNVARGIADLADSIPLVRNLDFLTSPMKVEYMTRQYLGTAGSYVITMADRMARAGYLPDMPFDPYMNLAEAENVVGTSKDFDWKSLIGGEGIANVPILGDLLTDPRTRGGRQQDFYEMIDELDTILATLNSINDRDRKKGFEYRQKHINVLKHQNQLRYIQNQMSEWRDRRDSLAKISRESMSDNAKRAYYQRLLEGRQRILSGVDRIMTSIKQG